MTVPEFQHRGPSWRIGLILCVAMLLWVHAAAQPAVATANKQPLLIPWTTLTGAWVAAPRPSPPSSLPRKPAFTGYLSWQSPTAVAARGNYVYVVDGGRRQIFRYDLAQQTMTPFADYAAGAVSAITVASDLSLYVADTNARQVLHFSFDGRLLQRFGNDMEMGRPVAVLLDETSGRLWVRSAGYLWSPFLCFY